MAIILGIDVGERKIGLAIGKTEIGQAFVRPPLLVTSWSEAWPPLTELIEQEQINTIVIGWPLHSSGQVSAQAEQVQQFITELERRVSIPIVRRDERGTTQAVQREHQAVGHQLPRGQEDSLAAQLLVESYLEELRHA